MLQLARPQDRQAVNEICRQGHADHVAWRPDLYKMDQELYDEQWYLKALQEKQLYVAKLGDVVVGYIRFQIFRFGGPGNVPRKAFMLEDIAVAEGCRNQGIGTEMMTDVQALAKAFGCTDLQLSVYPQNEAALALYRKFGFTIRNINMQRRV